MTENMEEKYKKIVDMLDQAILNADILLYNLQIVLKEKTKMEQEIKRLRYLLQHPTKMSLWEHLKQWFYHEK
jgi:hypothetical protein